MPRPKVTYQLVAIDVACRMQLPNWQAMSDYSDDYGSVLYRCEDGVPVEYIAEDGGEPEDQSFHRDWSWVPTRMPQAYDLGKKHGRDPD